MRAPDFWAAPPGAAANLLTPLGCLYAAAGRLRRMTIAPRSAVIPVICVGNLVAGGAGKTPVVMALARRMAAQRVHMPVHILTRGYGGQARGPLRVDPAKHGVREIGDEALLLAAEAPVWVARDRVAGARAAREAGAACLILDDGFQDPALHQDLPLLVIDGAYGFGNGRVIPAGPLREPVRDGLARTAAVVLIGEDRHGIAARLGELPVLRAALTPSAPTAAALSGQRVFAFAGIGRPEKFFDSLASLGCDIAARLKFADHHPYTRRQLDGLLTEAARLEAMPVTTAKDAVRLPGNLRAAVAVLDVTLQWDDEAALDRLLAEKLDARAA